MEDIVWQGPKALWSKNPDASILSDPNADAPGVYLWTVRTAGDFFVNYVGMSSTSIQSRQREHIENFLSGKYSTYDPAGLSNCEKKIIHEPSCGLDEFLSKYPEIAPKMRPMFERLQIFYAPRADSTEILKRIESGLILTLMVLPGFSEQFG